MAKSQRTSSAAYTLVDVSSLPEDVRNDLLNDANAGGGLYGVRVVEESVNGGARAAIYGVYKGDDEKKWNEAKKDLGISSSNVDDADVSSASVSTDPQKEAALREAAAQAAAAAADRIRSGEEADLQAVLGTAPTTGPVNSTDHSINIVDTGLAQEASNEASEAKPAKATAKTKTPR